MFRIVIPGRIASQRFPGKLTKKVDGTTIIEHVYNRCSKANPKSIHLSICPGLESTCSTFTDQYWVTPESLSSGTERIVSGMKNQPWDDSDIVVNVQGDEPLIHPRNIIQVAQLLQSSPSYQMATLWHHSEFHHTQNKVKCVVDSMGEVLYFSRAQIPFNTSMSNQPVKIHIGIYAYRVGFLKKYPNLEVSDLEKNENLEQLRALYNGYKIASAEAKEANHGGIDVPEDLDRLKHYWPNAEKV